MGKLKRGRQKYHASVVSEKSKVTPTTKESSVVPVVDEPHLPSTPRALPVTENIFAGVQISPEDLKQSLPDFDKQSIISCKSGVQEKKLKKKEKKILRHEAFLKKINALEQMRNEAKERKKRQKTVITGDMRPLADALPSLELLLKQKELKTELKKQAEKRQKSVPTMKQRKKNMLQDISTFKQVLTDPSYEADPIGIITEYIQAKIRQGIMDET